MISKFVNDLNLSEDILYDTDMDIAKLAGVSEPYAMPYFNKHSKTGVLLIHGFSASPHEMMNFTSLLEDNNFTVYSCLIAGHAVSIDKLNSTTYIDWYNSLKNGYLALQQCCDKIIVVGQSMGGLLAHLVSSLNKVDMIILFAPAYKITLSSIPYAKHLVPYAKFFRHFIKYYPRHLTDVEQRFNYNGFGIAGLYQMTLLQNYIIDNNLMVNSKAQLIVSDRDILISPEEAIIIFDKLFSSNIKSLITIDNDKYNVQHILTEPDHLVILNMALDFIKENV